MASKKSGTKAKPSSGAERGKSNVKQGLKGLDVRKAKEVRGGQASLSDFSFTQKVNKASP